MLDHGGIQVATFAGINLKGGRSGLADAVGIVFGLLIAFDHINRIALIDSADRGR